MRRSFVPVLVWGCFLGGFAAGELAFWTNPFGVGTLGGAAFVILAIAIYTWVTRRPPPDRMHFVPDLSYSTAVLGIGMSVALVGWAFGPWLFVPGLGLAGASLVSLVHEWRNGRKAV